MHFSDPSQVWCSSYYDEFKFCAALWQHTGRLIHPQGRSELRMYRLYTYNNCPMHSTAVLPITNKRFDRMQFRNVKENQMGTFRVLQTSYWREKSTTGLASKFYTERALQNAHNSPLDAFYTMLYLGTASYSVHERWRNFMFRQI